MHHFANTQDVEASGLSQEIKAELVADAKATRDKLVDALFRYGYHLPTEASERVEQFFHLTVEGRLIDANTHGIDHERISEDVKNFGQYVWLSLEATEKGETLPAAATPPTIARGDQAPWLPDVLPEGWRDY